MASGRSLNLSGPQILTAKWTVVSLWQDGVGIREALAQHLACGTQGASSSHCEQVTATQSQISGHTTAALTPAPDGWGGDPASPRAQRKQKSSGCIEGHPGGRLGPICWASLSQSKA